MEIQYLIGLAINYIISIFGMRWYLSVAYSKVGIWSNITKTKQIKERDLIATFFPYINFICFLCLLMNNNPKTKE